jgi:hypothetical protein
MKQPIALRLEVDLLKEVRRCASEENRTLTNFIETVLKARIAAGPCSLARPSAGELEAGEGRRRRRG